MAKRHETKVTRDHDEIRRWAEERQGTPATLLDTVDELGEPGILRFMFDDSDADALAELDWNDFFDRFDEEELYLLYQDETEGGDVSRFFKFVDEETAREGRKS